ncbi:MAG: MotA/TolQ/ExbB proton channel family protein [Chlorobi bacterium]|nr:MotA/TolQ/ExbB proton channel family protein [Chlorobiota bacterium]
MNLMLLLAQINLADTTAAGGQAGEITMSYWNLALKGGWVMLIIAFLSIVAVYIFVERWFVIRKASVEDNNFMNRIRDYIHDGKIDSALALCQSSEHPVSRMLEKGIQMIGRPINDVHAAIENVGRLEVYKLEKGLPSLATIAGGAPMLGFLGTVIGMIIAFYTMANAGNNVDISMLSNGIYAALVTTVAGLIVGIVAYFAYNILVARVEKVVFILEARTNDFMDLLNEPVEES